MTQPIASLHASPIRRVLAVGVLFATGFLLLGLVVMQPPASVGWTIYLIVMGAATLWIATRLTQATAHQVLLTDEGLFDSRGICICRMEDIADVERGVFAFKPSNGFLVRLNQSMPRAWAPGLWWRFGRKVGVGGVTPAAQAKFMAEVMAMRIVARRANADETEPE